MDSEPSNSYDVARLSVQASQDCSQKGIPSCQDWRITSPVLVLLTARKRTNWAQSAQTKSADDYDVCCVLVVLFGAHLAKVLANGDEGNSRRFRALRSDFWCWQRGNTAQLMKKYKRVGGPSRRIDYGSCVNDPRESLRGHWKPGVTIATKIWLVLQWQACSQLL